MKRSLAWLAGLSLLVASPLAAQTVPQFQVDPSWPKALPNNWLLGQVASVTVDSNDHVWVLQRPRTLSEDEKGATLKPPRNKCCAPAPSVMEFDADGNVIQVFKKDGTFVTEWFYDKSTLGGGSVWGLAMWPDTNQTFMVNIDGENNLARVLRRSDGQVVGGFGRSGRQAGDFHWVHALAVNSKGNVYTGEVDNGKRVQKFKPINGAPK